jgi:hypothetical protein
VRIAVVSDTHGRPLPPAAVARAGAAELLVHAGDVGSPEALAGLRALGPPLVAVAGNVDAPGLGLPAEEVVEAAGARIGVVHDAGPAKGRLERLRRRFPGCALVVFGHSHIPLHETAPDGFAIFNPGSATQRRRQPRHTMGEAVAEDGAVRVALVDLD